MRPRPFRVVRRRRDTSDTVTLALEAVDNGSLEFRPGQFTMLYAPGIGEVPISISGDPAQPWVLEHTVRDVGGVTTGICAARPGDVLGVRGPFGTGWEVGDGAGGDVVILAGGIGLAPLRPAVLEVLAHRGRFEHVAVVYGTRTPDAILYPRELEAWRDRLDVDVTVDVSTPDWRGRVGLVTALLAGAHFDPARTLALVCGPEVMMRHATAALGDRGVAPHRIRLSLERNMRCGIGLCGHCQLRELFVCVDGPVLPFERVRSLMATAEV
jgi:NAD(P)H-flavin reductase